MAELNINGEKHKGVLRHLWQHLWQHLRQHLCQQQQKAAGAGGGLCKQIKARRSFTHTHTCTDARMHTHTRMHTHMHTQKARKKKEAKNMPSHTQNKNSFIFLNNEGEKCHKKSHKLTSAYPEPTGPITYHSDTALIPTAGSALGPLPVTVTQFSSLVNTG